MGIIFFIWAGIFSVTLPAQFWGFANDIYTKEAGKRLFPIIAFGATFGALSGAKITDWFVGSLGIFPMMLVAGGILGICILLTFAIHKKEIKSIKDKTIQTGSQAEIREEDKEKPLAGGGGFRLLFKSRYLLYIAFFVMLLNFVNTNGQYILDNVVKRETAKAVEMGTIGGLDTGQFMTKFYAEYMVLMNLFAMGIQLFLVSRIFKWFGVRVAILFLPLISLGGYFSITFGASLLLVKWVKAVENGTDYSLMNTTRHALFLITKREEKYKAKAATDTFFHRAGDFLSSSLVFLGTTYFAFTVESFAKFTVGIIVVWISLGILIMGGYKKLSAEKPISLQE